MRPGGAATSHHCTATHRNFTTAPPPHHHRAQLRPGAGQLPVTTAGQLLGCGPLSVILVAAAAAVSRRPQSHTRTLHRHPPGHIHHGDKILWFSQPLNQYTSVVRGPSIAAEPPVPSPAHTNQRRCQARPGVAGAGQDAAQRRPLLLQHVPLRPARPQPRPRARRAARGGEPASPSRGHVPPRPRPRPPPRPRPAAQPAAGGAAEAQVPVQDATSCAKPEGKI